MESTVGRFLAFEMFLMAFLNRGFTFFSMFEYVYQLKQGLFIYRREIHNIYVTIVMRRVIGSH